MVVGYIRSPRLKESARKPLKGTAGSLMRLGEGAASGGTPKECQPLPLPSFALGLKGSRGTGGKALSNASHLAKSVRGEAFCHVALPLGRQVRNLPSAWQYDRGISFS